MTESRTPLQHLTQTLCLTPQHCAEEQVTFWEDVFPAQRHSLRLFFLFHTFSLITPTLLQPDRFISEHALDVSASTSYSILVSPSGMYSFLLDA